MRGKKRQQLYTYIWITIGIFFSIAFAMMRNSESFDFTEFFHQGKSYEFTREECTKSTSTCTFNEGLNYYYIGSDSAITKKIRLSSNREWNYLSLDVSNLNLNVVNWKLRYYDSNRVMLYEQPVMITAGNNMITLACPYSFQYICFKIENYPGLTFSLDGMELRESAILFDGKTFIVSVAATMLGYMMVTFLIYMVHRVGWYSLVEVLQDIYIQFGDMTGKRAARHWTKNGMRRLRIFLFWLLFTFMIVYQALALYDKEATYKYGILAAAIILILIGILSWESPLQHVNWHGILPVAWFSFWIYTCISDLFVSKFFKFTGYVFVLAVGFFYFMWNNMSRPKQMINNIISGLEWTFPFVLGFCLIFRPKQYLLLYNGAFRTREGMALYALVLLIAFLARIFFCLQATTDKKRVRWIVAYTIATSINIYFLYITNSTICMLTAALVVIMFVCYLWAARRELVLGIFKSTMVLAGALVCSAVIVIGLNQAIQVVPLQLGTTISLRGEIKETKMSPEELKAAKTQLPELLHGVKSASRISKTTVWKAHLSKMNLLGHAGRLRVNGEKMYAQNGYIEIAYRYGMFALIPYLLMLACCLYRAWRRRGYLMLAIVLAFGVTMLTQSVELPFLHPLWIVFYLGMGCFFPEKKIRNGVGH